MMTVHAHHLDLVANMDWPPHQPSTSYMDHNISCLDTSLNGIFNVFSGRSGSTMLGTSDSSSNGGRVGIVGQGFLVKNCPPLLEKVTTSSFSFQLL
eukprot:8368951-Ditylum_brightwellii.AAC.1